MSRRNRRKPSLFQQQNIERLVAAEVERRMSQIPPLALPSAANARPLNQDALWSQMNTQQAPAKVGTPMFPPGTPLRPMQGMPLPDGPRQFVYPVGVNIYSQPRSTETTSFETLRSLASLYDGIQLCEQVWLDTVAKLNLNIKPRPEIAAELGKSASDSKYSDKIRSYTDFFTYPDPGNGLDLKSWLRAAVRDQLQLDAVVIYVRKTRGGSVYSLELVDPATIKPIIDPRGRRPAPPFPAYEQFYYGVPADVFTSEQMLYLRETLRTESIYGLSRVERIIVRINQALRKENKDLARFTDGNVPPGILQPPDDGSQWTPETLLAYQEMWDALLAGNDQARSRIKVIQPGSQLTTMQEPDIFVDFDRFLLNVTAACYSMTMADLGFTESVNKSSGESQQNVFYRRAVQPLMDRYATLFTFVLRHYFNEQDLVVTWSGFEESEDFNAMVASYVALTNSGITSPTTAAHMLNLPWTGDEIPNFVLTKEGPTFLEDAADPGLRKATNNSKLAGLQFAAANPGGPPQPAQSEDGEEAEQDNTSQSKATKGNGKPQPAKKAAAKSSNAMKGSASKATPLQQGNNASKGRASKTKRSTSGDDDQESDPGRVSPIIQRGTKPTWRPPSKTQIDLEAKLAKAIRDYAKHTRLTKDGATMPDDGPRETLLNIVVDLLNNAANEGRSIATGMEQRGLISAAKNIAGYALQVVENIIDMISQKASDIINDLFGGGEVEDVGAAIEAAIDTAEAELVEWAEGYADLVGDTEIHDMIEGTIADEMQQQGKTQKYWVNDGEPCKLCIGNAEASPLALNETFPSGDDVAPGHPRCKCSMSYS